MSLWVCPTHGLYGGQIFCPRCDRVGSYATFTAQADRSAQRQDRETELGPKGESTVGEADAP